MGKIRDGQIMFIHGYERFIQQEGTNSLLERLKDGKAPNSFEFIRFFIFTKEQQECLQDTIFPSLKASQDLFRIKSFFLQKDQIKNSLKNEYNTYLGFIDDVWERIKQQHSIKDGEPFKVIEKRKHEHVPEFLILFKNKGKAVIHTYINGEAYKTLFDNNGVGVNNDYSALTNLIAYLAQSRLQKGNCDWIPKDANKVLNSKKSYIDWA